MNTYIDESALNEEELWKWCILEYKNSNPVIKYLISNYYIKIKKITEMLGENSKVLEVGCGAAESSDRIKKMLKNNHFEISDYDIRYVNMIKKHKPYFRNIIKQESVYNLQRKNNEFDCIMLLEVLEHLDDFELALSELFRVSKNYVVISVPNEPLWRILNLLRLKYVRDFGNTPGHLNHWNERKLMKLVGKYGEVTKVYKPLPWIIILAKVNN